MHLNYLFCHPSIRLSFIISAGPQEATPTVMMMSFRWKWVLFGFFFLKFRLHFWCQLCLEIIIVEKSTNWFPASVFFVGYFFFFFFFTTWHLVTWQKHSRCGSGCETLVDYFLSSSSSHSFHDLEFCSWFFFLKKKKFPLTSSSSSSTKDIFSPLSH